MSACSGGKQCGIPGKPIPSILWDVMQPVPPFRHYGPLSLGDQLLCHQRLLCGEHSMLPNKYTLQNHVL